MKTLTGLSTAAFLVACVSSMPAFAQVNVLDINTDNGINVDALDGTVGIGIGGSDNNVLDADVGNGAVEADVNTSDGINANIDALDGTVDADVRIGNGQLIDANVNIGGDGSSNGAEGADGNNGADGTNGINGNSGSLGSSRSGSQTTGASCLGPDSPVFVQLSGINYSSRMVSNWANAMDAQLIPVALCTGLDGQLASGLLAAVAPGIPAVKTALSSSSYSASDIIGIALSGQTLNVYVR